MKKIFLFLCLIPLNVYASSLYLDELEVANGELSLPFTKYNNEYTITLDTDIYMVNFKYKVSDDIIVSINDNYDLENNSVVTITLDNGEESSNYYFHILKEKEETTAVFLEDDTKYQDDGFMYKYKIYVIPLSCLLLIIIFHKIIFNKHKTKNI